MPTLKPLYCLSLATLLSSVLPSLAQAAPTVNASTPPGTVFKDCKDCPQMVVLPTGSFMMGTPEDEVGHEPDESPLHKVTFSKPLAISRFQVTAGEFDAYIKQTGAKIADGDDQIGRAHV